MSCMQKIISFKTSKIGFPQDICRTGTPLISLELHINLFSPEYNKNITLFVRLSLTQI